MKREITDYMEDVSQQIKRIEEFTSGITGYEDFRKSEITVYACVRALEIMGEAIKHIPDETRLQYPNIPWKQIAGMRDILVHDYFGIDEQVVWKTIRERLPKIKPLFEEMLKDVGK